MTITFTAPQYVYAGGGGGGGGGGGAESGEGATDSDSGNDSDTDTDTAPSVDNNAPNDNSVRGDGPPEGGDPAWTPEPPAPPTCPVSTTCGITTHADCSQSGAYDPLEPGCRPTLPTECVPSNRCGVSVLADCSTTGTYNNALPGCSSLPSGCGPGTLNNECPVQESSCVGQPVSIQCAPAEPPCSALGYLFTQVGDSCVFNRCAAGWQQVGDQCVMNQCPEGYVRQGNQCVAGCSAGYFYCGTGAQTGALYQRRFTSAPACVPQDLLYAQCDHGCNAARGACNPTPAADASINARPQLVRVGESVRVEWQATSVLGCVVTGTNGDRWSCSGAACANNSHTSSVISSQTTYMLSCAVTDAPNIVKTTTVNIVPVFIEQ